MAVRTDTNADLKNEVDQLMLETAAKMLGDNKTPNNDFQLQVIELANELVRTVKGL